MKRTNFIALSILTFLICQYTVFGILISSNSIKSDDFILGGLGFQSKVDSPFQLEWNVSWGGSDWDSGIDIAVDIQGKIYCLGFTKSFGAGNTDWALLKYQSDGKLIWNTTWGDETDNFWGEAIAVDTSGRIYGYGWGDLVYFDTDGRELWNKSYAGLELGDIITGPDGSLYLLELSCHLLKLHSNGTLIWEDTYNDYSGDNGVGITIDGDGAIYCVGAEEHLSEYDILVAKYFPNGTRAWRSVISSPTLDDRGNKIAIDPNTNAIYCIGNFVNLSGSSPYWDIAVTKLHPNGTLCWSTTWGQPENTDFGSSIAIGPSGSIYCLGYTNKTPNLFENFDIILFKYSPTGTLTAMWESESHMFIPSFGGISLTSSGDLYCLGTTHSGNLDFILLKFTLSGESNPSDGIPGFAMLYLIIGVLAIISIFYRKKVL